MALDDGGTRYPDFQESLISYLTESVYGSVRRPDFVLWLVNQVIPSSHKRVTETERGRTVRTETATVARGTETMDIPPLFVAIIDRNDGVERCVHYRRLDVESA